MIITKKQKPKWSRAVTAAEAKVERARARFRAATDGLNVQVTRYLLSCGWQTVYGGGFPYDRCWRAPNTGALFTTFAALREQRTREKRRAARAARNA